MATRRNVANRSGGGPRTRAFVNEDHQVIESPDQNTEEEESTDKDTRLTLMEEVLLIGLKDREVITDKVLIFFRNYSQMC